MKPSESVLPNEETVMSDSSANAPEALRAEILAEARRQAEDILRRARAEAEALLAKARAEAEQLRNERLAQARAEASRRAELVLATVSIETARLRALRVEALLQEICDEARRRLQPREGVDHGATLILLTVEAVRQMSGEAFVVKLSPTDRSAFENLLGAEVARRVGGSPVALTFADDASVTGGVIVQDVVGRQVWDNRLTARLERLWPELRRQIAVQAGLVTDNPKGGGA
jgi:V/A-type H+-transporting ATPase subunit E